MHERKPIFPFKNDIKLATNCSVPVYHTGHTGGIIPTPEEIIEKIKEIAEEVGL